MKRKHVCLRANILPRKVDFRGNSRYVQETGNKMANEKKIGRKHHHKLTVDGGTH